VKSAKQVNKGRFMFRQAAVKNREDFHPDEKDTDGQRISDNFRESLNRLFACVKASEMLQNQTKENQERRAEAKAEARNRGAMMAVSQKLRPGRPA